MVGAQSPTDDLKNHGPCEGTWSMVQYIFFIAKLEKVQVTFTESPTDDLTNPGTL